MLEPGQVIAGRFAVEGLLGEGGLAAVYRVRHLELGSIHALKLLTWRKRSLDERLIREGRIQAQLHHPNIVNVTDVVRHEGQLGLLMEYVDNQSVEDYLCAHGGLGLERGLALFAPILSAVAAAHAVGITHRDLKPANILLARTSTGLVPKVTDFGIAKVMAELAAGSTAVGATMGTPGYLAPEQVEDSSAIDNRADIFALGAIAWELITGRRAFADPDTGHCTVMSTTQRRMPPLSAYVADVPDSVEEALQRATALSPEDRFPDCASFAEALYAHRPDLIEDIRRFRPSGRSLDLSEPAVPRGPASEPGRETVSATAYVQPEPLQEEGRFVGGVRVGLLLAALVVVGSAAVFAAIVATMVGGRWFEEEASVSVRAGEAPAPSPMIEPAGSGSREAASPALVPPVDTPSRERATDRSVGGSSGETSPGGEAASTTARGSTEPGAMATSTPPTPHTTTADASMATQTTPDVGVTKEAPAGGAPAGDEPAVARTGDVADAPRTGAADAPESVVPDERGATDGGPSVEQPGAVPRAGAAVSIGTGSDAAVSALPSVGGVWKGRAARRPFELRLVQRGERLTGTAVFVVAPRPREEPVVGTVDATGAVSFRVGDLRFEGKLDDGRLEGSYRREGSGKQLRWSVGR